MPCGNWVSLAELDARFADVPREERGRLAILVLASISEAEREEMKRWVLALLKKHDMRERVEPGLLHLLVFYAIGFVTKAPNTVHTTVNLIVTKESIAGIIRPAR